MRLVTAVVLSLLAVVSVRESAAHGLVKVPAGTEIVVRIDTMPSDINATRHSVALAKGFTASGLEVASERAAAVLTLEHRADQAVITGVELRIEGKPVAFPIQAVPLSGPKLTLRTARLVALRLASAGHGTPGRVLLRAAPSDGGATHITIPAGTRLVVRVETPIIIEAKRVGNVFIATLETRLEVGDRVVAPAGTRAYGRLTATDGNSATLELTQLNVEGGMLRVQTDSLTTPAAAAVPAETVFEFLIHAPVVIGFAPPKTTED